jgi:hypothetical protein
VERWLSFCCSLLAMTGETLVELQWLVAKPQPVQFAC